MLTKKISNDIITICRSFSEKCYLTNIDEYVKRNQTDFEKIKNDIFFGKIAEFGVYFILLEKGVKDISIPDLNIYNFKNKSFDADLKSKAIDFHIKTQTKKTSKIFGESWLFQKSDPLVLNPKSKDYFIGTQYDEDTSEVKILLHKKAKDLKYDKPKLEKLYNKTCVYLKNNV